MNLTRPLPESGYLSAIANPMLRTTAGDVIAAGADTLGRLALRGARIRNREQPDYQVIDGQVTQRTERDDTLSVDQLKAAYPWVEFDRPMTEESARVIAEARKAQMIREDVVARGPGGAAGLGASLVGGLKSMATDPLEIASAFIPVVGPASKAILVGRLGRVGGRIAEGVIEGGVGNIITEPFYYTLSRSQKLDYDMSDALLNVGLGAAFGGIIGVGRAAGAVARGADRLPRVDAPVVRPDTGLSPVARMQALRTSVAQMAQGRDVEVAAMPVVKMPVVKMPETALEALRAVGVKDEGGDLAAMGLRDWDKTQKFKRNVMREDGIARDEAARYLWDQGYLRDQPEAPEMLAAERGEGPEPDLTVAMDRVIDAEMRGEASFRQSDAGQGMDFAAQQAYRAHEGRRADMREVVGNLPDERIDTIMELVTRFGLEPEDAAARARVYADPIGQAQREADFRPDEEEWSREVEADTDRDFDFEEDDAMLDARLMDLSRRGLIGDDDLVPVNDMVARATKAGEISRAAAACLASVPF